jgi:thiamine transport system permease protein
MLSTLPFVYAMARLQSVTSQTPLEALLNFPEAYGAIDALRFTLLEASASAILTVLFGLPIAWYLGRYQWKHATLLRAVFSVPFVMPAIVVAMGFLLLIDQQSLLFKAGLDLRTETGVIGAYAQRTGWSHPGHFLALIIAHAWFNLSLIIPVCRANRRSIGPCLGRTNEFARPRTEHIWKVAAFVVAGLGPCSALCSITQFPLLVHFVRPREVASTVQPHPRVIDGVLWRFSGDCNYRVDTSEIVMSASIVQFLILLSALYLTSTLQRRHSSRFALVSEHGAQASRGPPTFKAKVTVYAGFVFALAPMVAASTGILSNSKQN